MFITVSFCCTYETNSTLYSNEIFKNKVARRVLRNTKRSQKNFLDLLDQSSQKKFSQLASPFGQVCDHCWGVPGGSDGKESACNMGNLGLIPGSGRSPREWHDNPLQGCCLENSVHRGSWQAIVHGVVKSWTRLGD